MFTFCLKKSCEWGSNIMDWIRSVYFSLFGSSTLTLALKWYSLSWIALALYISGIIMFFCGLYYSVIITNRFKQLEKDYENDTVLDKDKIPLHPNYYLLKDRKYKHQHFLLFALGVPAILLMVYSGFFMESKATRSSAEGKEMLQNVQENVQQIDSLLQTIKQNDAERKLLQDSLDRSRIEVDLQKKEIELLKNSTIPPKLKPKKGNH